MNISSFFTKDKHFYSTVARLMTAIIFQNIIAYSVNMADNIMLGMYTQDALSGAATVNQIQFMVQQITMAIGDSIVVIGGQYWGKKCPEKIRQLTVFALAIGAVFGSAVFLWTFLSPRSVLAIFTNNASYISEGVIYLKLICYTYPIYIISTILLASLRSVETVHLALKVSLVSLFVNIVINYVLIFGMFGFPELGIFGAAIGTLTSRILELIIILLYIIFKDKLPDTSKKNYGKKLKKSNLTKNKNVSFNPIKYTIDGYTIYVGRNNKENDYLTLKFANKTDLWFHTQDIHGSHVILKSENKTPSKDLLTKIASIAAFHSKGRNSSNVPVDYCEVKYVKKPNNAKPGMVIYTHQHTLVVNPSINFSK